MADENEDDEPAVELGEGEPVDGAPVARLASRLHWPIQKSEVARRVGDETVRTPEGPRELGDLLTDVEETYFESQRDFLGEIRAVTATGAVPTADE
ncbi:DUF5789 family protein [Halorussus marinus]|uniref:DUF5789 family protein n=1 Tax=Halorussus marinus TaxID=2505976 RepID=UPI00106E7461|nr:DUF5789 family protein [Halorussus marinus]